MIFFDVSIPKNILIQLKKYSAVFFLSAPCLFFFIQYWYWFPDHGIFVAEYLALGILAPFSKSIFCFCHVLAFG